MASLFSLTYISKNMIPGTQDDINFQIESILAAAQKNNPALGVTGALLYSGGYFCQVIEGEDEVLEDLFETIQMDARHGEVTVLQFEPIKERSFSQWGMALAGIEEEMRIDIEGVLGSKDELKTFETGRNMVALLEQMVAQHQSVFNAK